MSSRPYALLLTLCCIPALAVHAQTPAAAPPPPPPAAAGPVDAAKSLDVQLSFIEKDVVSLAEAMPADKYNFMPQASDFSASLKPEYTGVRTFGQEIAHVAQANYFYATMFSGLKPNTDVQAVGKGTDKEAAVASLKASFAFLHQAVATITAANAFDHAGRGPLDSRASIFAAVLAHNRDHYGQLVEYLRMNGILPPASQGRPLANPPKS